MLKQNLKTNGKAISAVFTIFSLVFILLIQGAIPFQSIPTLGQAIWTTGFSQSFANQSILDLYAINFGIPNPAAISFGLAGAYPASLFIRAGLHASDAYTLMAALWLSVAFYGAWKVASSFKLSAILSTLASTLWLSLPVIWWHAGYSMLSTGIALLPFYLWTTLRLFQCFDNKQNTSIQLAGLYISATIVAVFMDGYSFMMFAIGSSLIGVYTLLRFPEHKKIILKFSFPVHFFSFTLAYILYASYIGKTQFAPAPLDFFRGWGVDLIFLAAPSKGIHWLWDAIGVSLPRTNFEQFGDASVWSTSFALPVIIVGALAWWRTHKDYKLATGFLIIALFGFYMGMGPSIKLNSTKPEGANNPLMAQKYAVAPTGNAWLSKYVPGFKSMRASYRWTALGFLGLWLLIVLLLSREQETRLKWLVVISVIFLIMSNSPNINEKLTKNIKFRNDFFDIEKSLVADMKLALHKGEIVAFLPYRNDFFVNYLASRINIYTYNIGGDKNLAEARKYWPETMKQFKVGKIDEHFSQGLLQLLARGEADAIVLPYIDLLWAAHTWPAPLKYKNEIKPVIENLRSSDFVDVEERNLYAVVRLNKNFSNSAQLGQVEKNYCVPPNCMQYKGTNQMQHQVGKYTGSGIQTDNRPGYLMYGPYQQMNAGVYNLQITGKIESNGEHVVVDIVDHEAGKTYARFEGLKTSSNNILLQEEVKLYGNIEALEIRIHVDKDTDLFVDSYNLKPINTETRKNTK